MAHQHLKRPWHHAGAFRFGAHSGRRHRCVARFVAQIHGTRWYSLVPIGTRRSSAVPTSPN